MHSTEMLIHLHNEMLTEMLIACRHVLYSWASHRSHVLQMYKITTYACRKALLENLSPTKRFYQNAYPTVMITERSVFIFQSINIVTSLCTIVPLLVFHIR